MTKIKLILNVIILFSPAFLLAQIPNTIFNEATEDLYDAKVFTSKDQPLKNRTGVYHFGESEVEWDLVVLQYHNSLIIQVWEGSWGKDHFTHELAWLRQCKTYNEIKMDKNKFYFGKYSGLFVENTAGKRSNNAVLLNGEPTSETDRLYGKDSANIGSYYISTDTFFSDQKYYPLSTGILDENYFTGKTKNELKLMRNEILAKYGLIFQKGGEMEKYFKNQDWYKPHLKDVNNLLTDIEKENISTILKLEK